MNTNNKVAITGAFGYTGKYITRRLLASGKQVITLTGSPDKPNEFGDRVKAYPFDFEKPNTLAANLEGVDTLYNTYWVRFDHGQTSFDGAVKNTKTLIAAAKQAGARKIVHVSITNPNAASPLPYFSGKAALEKAVIESGLSYAIIRPTVIFGREDILINNIAYLLRKFPIFIIPGDGNYRLQPIFVEDMAELCTQAAEAKENMIIDAIGPDIFTFSELVSMIKKHIHSSSKIFNMPYFFPFLISQVIGLWLRDVVLTHDEYKGLSSDLLISNQSPTGYTHLSEWLELNAEWVGAQYASEIGRHYSASPA